MNKFEYDLKINFALKKAGNGRGWNARFLYWLDVFELMLKSEEYIDLTGQGMDIEAPWPVTGEQSTWPPHSKIGDKNEV